MNFESLNTKALPLGIDSTDEVYFEWWLLEMMANGFIQKFGRCIRFNLIESTKLNAMVFKPTIKEPSRSLKVERELLRSWTYEPDYDILWTDKGYNFIFQDIDEYNDTKLKTYFYAKKTQLGYLSTVDVKPIAFRGAVMSSSVKFPLIQKMMYLKYDCFVNKISPRGKGSLYDKTFTPDRFLLQDTKPRPRKINPKQWIPITIEEFLNRDYEN